MESYHGVVITPKDAIILLEAATQKLIPKVPRRLTDYERSKLVKNGAIFIWDEDLSKMKRWTDGKDWSASRVSGVFLSYKEMEPAKSSTNSNKSSNFNYKSTGLVKQSFSVKTEKGSKLHLVSYFSNDNQNELLVRPSEDPRFDNLVIDKSQYPSSMLDDESEQEAKQIKKRPILQELEKAYQCEQKQVTKKRLSFNSDMSDSPLKKSRRASLQSPFQTPLGTPFGTPLMSLGSPTDATFSQLTNNNSSSQLFALQPPNIFGASAPMKYTFSNTSSNSSPLSTPRLNGSPALSCASMSLPPIPQTQSSTTSSPVLKGNSSGYQLPSLAQLGLFNDSESSLSLPLTSGNGSNSAVNAADVMLPPLRDDYSYGRAFSQRF